MNRFLGGLFTLVLMASPAWGQRIAWRNLVTVYGDNTEFFNPYRAGETILGGQFQSVAVLGFGERASVHAGVFGDFRFGSGEFLDEVKPVLSARYTTTTSLGVFGTLETVRRHGLIEPLAVTTLEITRPVEYGIQWIERRKAVDLDLFLNWQAINTESQREVFDYGWTLRVRPIRQLSLESQLHGLHHGGQLFSAGVPVTNNVASGFGVALSDTLGPLGLAAIRIYRLRSSGNIDPNAPVDRPRKGRGTWIRASIAPLKPLELFGLYWRGRDFLSQEGDNNYNSVGANPSFYRSRRKYLEFGVLRRGRLDGDATLDAEFRVHRIDDLKSVAFRGSSWEYSYRLIVRAPLQFVLR